MRRLVSLNRALCVFATLLVAQSSGAAEPRLEFPVLQDGRRVIPVDLHTHTVFSDGLVWPTVRVDEALEEGLGAIAITDHVEFPWFAKDVRSEDKNRPYAIAQDYAAGRIGIINGAEITRQMPPGHFIATFLKDANAVLTVAPTSDLKELKEGAAYGERETFLKALKNARSQGAFSFWAHPLDPPAPVPGQIVQSIHRQVIAAGLIQGIEVANPHWGFMREAFDIALKYNLAILATSDVHSPIERHNHVLGNSHRSVTLVLAKGTGVDDIKDALLAGSSVAFYGDYFIGRERELVPLMKSLLTATIVSATPLKVGKDIVVRFHNASPIPLRLRGVADDLVQEPFGQIDVGAGQWRDQKLRIRSNVAAYAVPIVIDNVRISEWEHFKLNLVLKNQ